MLDFISTLLEEGISTNCTDNKSGRSFISKEGLIAIVKDSADRNGIENVMSVLVNGPKYVIFDKDVLLIAINENYSSYKNVKIKSIKNNQVSQTVQLEISCVIEKYSCEENNTRDTCYSMNDIYKYPVMCDYNDTINISFEDCYKAEIIYNENHIAAAYEEHNDTPVEESTAE